MGGKSGSTVTGFRYLFGIHMGLGRGPVDEVVEARVGDELAWQGSATVGNENHTINAPNLFGGDKKEGGIKGPFRVMMGEADQVPSAELSAMLAPTPVTGFRRMLTIFYDGLVASGNPYPKKWAWRVRRAVTGWDTEVWRPDLAVIELMGPEAPVIDDEVGGETPIETVVTTITALMPASNAQRARAHLVLEGGRRVTSIGGFTWNVPGTEIFRSDGNTPHEYVYNPDGSADILAPWAALGAFGTLMWTYEEPGGATGTGVETFSFNLLEDPTPTMLQAQCVLVPLPGSTVTSVNQVFYMPDTESPTTLYLVKFTSELKSDGTATVNVDPARWGKTFVIDFTQTPTAGGAPTEPSVTVIAETVINHPTLQVVAPSGGTLIEILGVDCDIENIDTGGGGGDGSGGDGGDNNGSDDGSGSVGGGGEGGSA